jgi:6,7-dimethyl-8-ribityllumazine synthase
MKKGSPTLQVDGSGLSVAIVAASWHTTVMDGLIDGARRGLADAGVTSVELVRVPGAFELPVACSRLAASYDTVIALGVVIQGGTPHFDYICQAVAMGLTDVSVRTGVPVGFGVLTCNDDQQAIDRAGLEGSSEDKGHEAATAAVATVVTLRGLQAETQSDRRSIFLAGRAARRH